MRVIFMGTPGFAVPSLQALARSQDVVGVFTKPDAQSGRGGTKRPCAVKEAATSLGLRVESPRSLRSDDARDLVGALEADVICVAAYGLILPQAVLDLPRLGALNVHASLLPRWRGAAPIQRAILAGDEVTGVSIMQMEAGLDTGPYCLQVETPIAEKTAAELTAELAELGAGALLSVLPAVADGTARWIEQVESLVTYAEKVGKDDVAPDPLFTAAENVRRIRASLPAAPARVLLGNRGVTLVKARMGSDALAPGAVRTTSDALLLGTSDGTVVVEHLKPEGKAEMRASDWTRGARLSDDTTWKCAR
jgi:methionyl-tRNA formyltransferase